MATIYNFNEELPAATAAPLPGDKALVYVTASGNMQSMDAGLLRAQSYTAAGATLTLTAASHAGKTIKLDTAAGSIVTLPAATGTGNVYRFVVSVIATTNSHIAKVANASDAMQGVIFSMDDTSANAVAFAAVAGTDDTITLNRTTTGSVTVGEYFEVEDFATNRFHVRGFVTNTGTPATMFSATV